MRFLVRQHDQQTTHSGPGDAPEGGLEATRAAQGRKFLTAADEAIQRALAGSNSETFLRAGQQQGGE
jgi:hypothetical protein